MTMAKIYYSVNVTHQRIMVTPQYIMRKWQAPVVWSAAMWKAKTTAFVNRYFDSIIIQFGMLGVTLLSCAWYIIGTYTTHGQSDAIEIFFFSVFFFDYSMSIIAIQRKFDYVFSAIGFFDLMSMVPIIALSPSLDPKNTLSSSASWIGFVRFLRILNIFHLIRRRNSFTSTGERKVASIVLDLSEFTYQIGILCVNLLVFILVSAGVVFSVTLFEGDAFYTPFDEPMTWFDSFYFAVVTATTVGYGDISPNTYSAKFVSILIIIFGFSLIPAQVATLLTVLYQRPKYIGALAMPINTQHICICGIVDYELLYRLLTEIYHPTHAFATTGANITVVVLSPVLPSKQVETLLRGSSFRSKVRYFVGSSKSPIDLYRIKAEDSLAIYIVSDVIANSLRDEEDAVFISAISVSRYLSSKIAERMHQYSEENLRSSIIVNEQIYINEVDGGSSSFAASESQRPRRTRYGDNSRPRTLLKLASSARNRKVLANCGIDIILSLQGFKYTLIAYGAVFPGFLSLFLNLNRSRTMPQRSSRHKWRQPELYYEGTRFCVQQMATDTDNTCRKSLRVMSYHEAVVSLYCRSNGLVFLVAIKTNGIVYINPSDIEIIESNRGNVPTVESHGCIGDCDAIFLISPSWEIAWKILTEEDNLCREGNTRYNLDCRNQDTDDAHKKGFQLHNQDDQNAIKFDRSASSLGSRSGSIETKDLEQKDSLDHDFVGVKDTIGKFNPSLIKVHHLKSCIASAIKASKVPTCDRHEEAPFGGNTSELQRGDQRKETIGEDFELPVREPVSERPSFFRELPDFQAPLTDHVVLIMSSANRDEVISASARLVPIVHFVKAVRTQSCEIIVVLCEHAEELSSVIDEIDEANPRLFERVFFFSGYMRNPEHLITCGVETARVITIISYPRAAEASEEGLDTSRSAMVNADRHTIITSLSLQMILQQYRTKQQQELKQYKRKNEEDQNPKVLSNRPFIVCELVHESNITFLREQRQEMQENIYTRYGQPFKTKSSDSYSGNLLLMDDATIDYYDWPVLAAGCVFSHTLLDALMVQAIYNPDIISFWEAIMKTGEQGQCTVNANHANHANHRNSTVELVRFRKNLSETLCDKRKGGSVQNPMEMKTAVEGQSMLIPSLVSHTSHEMLEKRMTESEYDFSSRIGRGDDNDTSAAEGQPYDKSQTHGIANHSVGQLHHDNVNSISTNGSVSLESYTAGNEGKSDTTSSSQNRCQGLVDKIAVPDTFVGKTFSAFFHSYFEHDGTIAIALYRSHSAVHTPYLDTRNRHDGKNEIEKQSLGTLLSSPYVVTAPSRDTVLFSTDEIFILRGRIGQ